MVKKSDIDVVALGELLIDFSPSGTGGNGNPLFEMNPGGAPVNCLAAINRLGARTEFIGKVGEDNFGGFLNQVLVNAGIGNTGLSFTGDTHTTMAFVHLESNGERSFSFLRDPGADTQLTKKDIDLSLIDRSKMVHFGSLSFTDNPVRDTLQYVLKYAKKKGKMISYDPNYRPLLWENEKTALYWMKEGLKYADIVKMSEEEAELLTGYSDIEKAAKTVWESGCKKVFVTMGEQGAYYFAGQDNHGFVPAFSVEAVDTTGCGDAFMGAVLYQTLYQTTRKMSETVQFANAVGALCATKKGGIPAMPTEEEALKLIRNKA